MKNNPYAKEPTTTKTWEATRLKLKKLAGLEEETMMKTVDKLVTDRLNEIIPGVAVYADSAEEEAIS